MEHFHCFSWSVGLHEVESALAEMRRLQSIKNERKKSSKLHYWICKENSAVSKS